MKIYPIQHILLFQPAVLESEYLSGQLNLLPKSIKVDGKTEYYVERIEDLCLNRRRNHHEYLVKWVGYDDLSWHPVSNFRDIIAAEEFYLRNLNRLEPET